MKTSMYHAPNGIDIEYILCKAHEPSNKMIVAFPGPAGMRGGEWGYFITIRQFKDVNILFPRTNPELTRGRMVFRNGKPVFEEAIMALVNQCARETESSQLIAIGSSMGGWCALYYGLKYNWDIISGSPPYTFLHCSMETIRYASGNMERGQEWLDGILAHIVDEAGERGYKKKCFISYGTEEWPWKNSSEGVQLFKDLDKNGIEFESEFYPFSNHLTVRELFPHILKSWLPFYLGIEASPKKTGSKILMKNSKAFLLKSLEDIYTDLSSFIDDCNDIDPNLDIKYCTHNGNADQWIALRNYIYIKNGWYWGVGSNYKNPVEITHHKSFWEIEKIADDWDVLSFIFQDTILLYYEKTQKEEILLWLIENVTSYFRYLTNISPNRIRTMDWRAHYFRLIFFISFHKSIGKRKEGEILSKDIALEIKRSLKLFLQKVNSTFFFGWHMKVAMALLHIAMYLKNDSAVYQKLINSAMDILRLLVEYHFDGNGVCVSGQLDVQDRFVWYLEGIMRFVDANGMDNPSIDLMKGKRKKLWEYTSHISQPGEILTTIGHTEPSMRRTRSAVKRSNGNYIKPSSNIAILENELSYITINGGSNIHSEWKHCDLLSFTWFYNGTRIFCDAGGGTGQCEEYASSSIAHNAFICDDMNYVTPDYEDWTAIDEEIEEREDCVIVPTSHHLIDGVTMKRKFFWIKPNIMILIDEGIADRDRHFVQNFLLDDFTVDKSDINKVLIQSSTGIHVSISQHIQEREMTLEEYRGTNHANDEKHYRGSLIENWKTPRKALNLAYTKTGKKTRFVTSIECHSKKDEVREKEFDVQSLNFDKAGNLIIVLGDGTVIWEKMRRL